METGDPKQVAVLAALAVGAVGFLLTRLGGKAAPVAATAARAETAPKSRTTVALALVRDPFSHPRLAPKPTRVATAEPDPTTSPKRAVPSLLIGSLPAADLAPVGPLAPKLLSASHPKAPASKLAPSTTVGLEAIAGASNAVAFLTVDGAESRPFRPTERIARAVRLLRVEDGDVVLSGPKGKLTLNVGERKTL